MNEKELENILKIIPEDKKRDILMFAKGLTASEETQKIFSSNLTTEE